MAWRRGTLYRTRVEGSRRVLRRPPSLPPSTPDVSEATKYGRLKDIDR
jgi:hypothetical protein